MHQWIIPFFCILSIVLLLCWISYLAFKLLEFHSTCDFVRRRVGYHQQFQQMDPITLQNSPNVRDLQKYPILYINLDASTHRKTFMENQFQKLGVSAFRIPGVTVDPLVSELCPQLRHNRISQIEMAVFLAHYHAIQHAYDHSMEIVVILEDDASFELIMDWKYPLSEYIKNLPSEWELLHLSNLVYKDTWEEPLWKPRKGRSIYSTAYCIHRRGMKKILDIPIEKCRFRSDIEMFGVLNEMYLLSTVLFVPYNDTSHFQSTIHQHHTLRQIKLANEWIRKIKNVVS